MNREKLKTYVLIIFCFLMAGRAVAQAGNFPVQNGIKFSPRWIDNLIFLNNMGKKELPAEKQMLYLWAETKLIGEASQDFASLADYDHFQEFCSSHNISHLGGPMLGNITGSSVDVWVRTVRPDKVTVKLKVDGKSKTFGPVKSKKSTKLSAVVHLSGLTPNTRYPYQVFVRGQKISIPEDARIKTLRDSDDVNTRIVYGGDFHRWGFGNMEQSNTIIDRNPDAFLGLGDMAMADDSNMVGRRSLDLLARDLYPAWQNLAARIPVYNIWDDHDYFGNDMYTIPKGFTNEDRENAWKAFRYGWNNPSYGFGDDGKGIFFHTRLGPADLIMIDGRYFRKKGNYLGDKQMKWLKEQLLDAKGPFIILADGTMWSKYVTRGKDGWNAFDPEGKEEIFNLIEKNNIKGVLIISGDRHGARGFRIPRPSGFNFYEFEVGSLGGLSGPPAKRPEWTTQFYGISGGYAFGEFTFNTKKADPTVTFRLIGGGGKIIYKRTLKRSELSAPLHR